jgi:hypothetical protein
MIQKYTTDQYWKIFYKLPEELQVAVLSAETADSIFRACEHQGIGDDKISLVGTLVGDVLMGVIRPEEFREALQTEIGLDENTATNIDREINRLIFSPLRPFLAKTFNPNQSTPAGSMGPVNEQPQQMSPKTEEKTNGSDNYRESIE